MVHIDLIHGFTQDSRVWDRVLEALPSDWSVRPIDLPGHGSNGDMRPRTPDEFLRLTSELLEGNPEADRRVLCGYSMGGRVALTLSAATPEQWTDLVVVSAGVGINGVSERAARREADEFLATRYLDEGWIEEFASHWDSLSIWDGDPQDVKQARLAMLLQQDPEGLAAALRSFGQGVSPPFDGFGPGGEPSLSVIRGERDSSYNIPTEQLAMLAGTSPKVVAGSHSLLLENPGAIAEVISGL